MFTNNTASGGFDHANRYTEERIVAILQEAQRVDTQRVETGRWGMSVSEIKRLKALEKENAKLKKLLIEQILIKEALKEITEKK